MKPSIITTRKLFMAQYQDGRLLRYDLVIRCLTVEAHLRGETYPVIYAAYCEHRSKYVANPEPRTAAEIWPYFIELIDSIASGYDARHPIEVYTNGLVSDGIHRLSICLALGSMNIPTVSGSAPPADVDYPDGEYLKRAFGSDDIARLEAKERELLGRERWWK